MYLYFLEGGPPPKLPLQGSWDDVSGLAFAGTVTLRSPPPRHDRTEPLGEQRRP
jgi:hypothetical protein